MGDGIYGMVSWEKMSRGAANRRRTYEITPGADFIQTEFGYFCMDAWRAQGKIEGEHHGWQYDEYTKKKFLLEDDGRFFLHGMNWLGAEFYPPFEDKVLERLGDKEVVQDSYGRKVLVYKRSRSGYMPEYMDHPVKDMLSWEELCRWRLDPDTRQRYMDLDKRIPEAIEAAHRGTMIVQKLCGGYMYLRSLIGPQALFYMFYDDPELIHACMRQWLAVADAVVAYHQKYLTLDELFFGEDITYNKGPLISPDMIREFLFPYYTKLIENTKKRQLDTTRKLYLQLDTDGNCESVIPLYQSIGFNVFSPFEVASGSDVVAIGKKFPDIVISGGIDKREFSKSKEELKAYLDKILPVMKRRGGYIPTCDHGVPEEADFDAYVYYRKYSSDMNLKMNSIQRVLATAERRPVDRPACWLGDPTPEAARILCDYYKVKDVRELKRKCGDDFYAVEVPYQSETCNAIFSAFDWYRNGCNVDSEHRTLTADGCFAGCEDLEDVIAIDFPWPDPEKYIDPEECRRLVSEAPADKAVLGMLWACHFQDVCAAFGMQKCLMNMLTEPEMVHYLNNRIVDFYMKALRIFLEAAKGKVHMILIGNDLGSQNGLIISPELISEFVIPGAKRLVALAHSYGVKVMYHSCGSIEDAIPLLIDAGVDIIHPIQALAAGMNPEHLKGRFGQQVSFCGGVDTQMLLPYGKPEQVAQRVKELRRCFPTGLIISPSHEAILPDVPPANVKAMFDGAGKIYTTDSYN